MRKFLFSIILAIVALVTTSATAEEKFVNPVFYKGMINYGKEPKFIQITPTSYYEQNCYGYRLSAKCELWENTENVVTLKCLHLPEDRNDKQALIIVGYDNPPETWNHKFVVKELQDSNEGTNIRVYDYYENEKESIGRWGYFAYHSEKQQKQEWEDILRTFKEESTENTASD